MRALIQRLHDRLGPGAGEHTDERLLADFLARRADEAFAAIVRRHGPMVRGVCRRVLRNDADADDALQAVWLVLLRRADRVSPRGQLGNWLYGVAVNVARRGRDAAARRRALELTHDVPGREAPRNDLSEVIDQELSALPAAYRAAVVACDLEGHTRSEAAGRLGWSEGTVASRLARGRALLADRLTRRGIVAPAAALVAVLGAGAAGAVPVFEWSLLRHPSPAAEGLAREVIGAMTSNKLQTAAVALLAAVGLAGAGAATVWACGGYGPRPTPPVATNKPFTLESVETRESAAGAAWARQIVSVPADAGIDKPAGDATAGAAKGARFVLTNPARDITIVSDRHETFVEFFRRQPVLVATVPGAVLKKWRAPGTRAPDFEFLAQASFNVDGPRVAAYGASVKLAPLPTAGPLAEALDLYLMETEPLIFVRDAGDQNLWHIAGYTRRASHGFFAAAERVRPDDFAPADLLHLTDKK